MKTITPKQVGRLLWMIGSGNLSKHLRPAHEEKGGMAVDMTHANFETWLEGNISSEEAFDLISSMLNDHLDPEDIFELFLNNHSYNRQVYEVAR